MPRIHWVARGTGIPKDRDEVNRREVCECEIFVVKEFSFFFPCIFIFSAGQKKQGGILEADIFS